MWFFDCSCTHVHYRIVLGKCPWAHTTQAPKFKGGWLHMEVMLECFNYPHTCTCIMLCQSQPDSGESCIVLEIGSTRSPVAKLLQLSYAVHELCAASEEHCERGYRQVCVWNCRMSWRQTHIKLIAATYVSSVDLLLTICARI